MNIEQLTTETLFYDNNYNDQFTQQHCTNGILLKLYKNIQVTLFLLTSWVFGI